MVDADDLDHGFELRGLRLRSLCFGFGRSTGFGLRLGRRSAFAFVDSGAFGFGVGRRAREPAVAAFHASMSWPAHGSKSDSSGSWPGRFASGTWIRLTRTRYQTADRPRMPSTRMSAGSRYCDDLRMARLPALEALQRLLLELGAGDLDDRDRRLAPAGRRRLRADPLGRQAGVRVAGRDGGGAFGGDLRRRPARLAAPGSYSDWRAARPSTAGPAAVRRPASRSSAATGRRPGPRPRRGRSAPGAPRASRPRRRCRRPGRRSPRTGPAPCRS